MYSGLDFDSSYILEMYSEIMPIDNNCTPEKNVILTIIDVQPAANWFHLKIYEHIVYTNIKKDKTIEKVPIMLINFKGLLEKLIIPS